MPAQPLNTRPPLALAQQRTTLNALLRDRVRAMLAAAGSPVAGSEAEVAAAERASDDAASLDAQVRWFAEQVERENDRRQRLAAPNLPVLDYGDAVVIEGERGIEVVDRTAYRAHPLYHQARVGLVEQLIVGADLLALLRDDDDEAARRGAEQLGLA